MPRRNANATRNGAPVGRNTGIERVNFRKALRDLAESVTGTRAEHLTVAADRATREGFVPSTQSHAARVLEIFRTLTVRA